MLSGIHIPFAEVHVREKILNGCNRLLADRGRPAIDSGAVVAAASKGLFPSTLPPDAMADWDRVIAEDGSRQTTGCVASILADPLDSPPAGDGQGSHATAGPEAGTPPSMVEG